MTSAVDLCGGPGGWEADAAELGIDITGIELDPTACETRRNAGLPTIEADISLLDPHAFADMDGLIASPPCPAFSSAGKGEGREHLPALAAAIHRRNWACRPSPDPKVWLGLEVGRWYEAIRPEWVALEQVPAVLPLWEAYATILRADGYSVWCGLLCAADYGVPQTRTRAILMAHRTRAAHPPAATHAERPEASLFGTLRPWVTMAEALGWGMTQRPAFTLAPGTAGGGADAAGIGGSGARNALRREREEGRWLLDRRNNGAPVLDMRKVPAPTVTTIAGAKSQWVMTRPATTVQGDPRLAPPGHRDRDAGERQFPDGTIRLTVAQALTLQGFPADYPLAGGRTKQFEQVGNAIPPPLARAILSRLVHAQEAAA